MSEWQPIDTAPKEGAFLVTDGSYIAEVFAKRCGSGFSTTVDGYIFNDATHWMPNPAFPGDAAARPSGQGLARVGKQDLAKDDAALLYTNREKLYMDTPQNVPNTADNTPKGGGDVDRTCVCREPYWKQWKDGTTYCTRCGWRQGRTSFTNKEMSDAIAKTSMECLAYDPTPKPNVLRDANHCVDCCCARSWKALGVTEYTGKSIPEHIDALLAERDALSAHDSQCIKDRVSFCEEIEELEAVVERLTAERDAARAELKEAVEAMMDAREHIRTDTPRLAIVAIDAFLARVSKQPKVGTPNRGEGKS